ncbi:YceD family protein [Planktotalea sp.]|uniref:YceD family protein n=1 Tax=Planktotalea sp. TaxID=2029877 RepID=UPI003D6B44B5
MDETRAFPDFILDTSALARRKTTHFEHRLEAAQLKALMADLGLIGLRKTIFKGSLSPAGKQDWVLNAHLGATAVQPCTVTLEPVTTRIDTEITRRFVVEMPTASNDVEEDEFGGTAMLEDDSIEPLGREIDLWAVMSEALALALPDYPRIEGAELGALNVTEPGKDALSDDSAKPFAGLAALKDKLEGGS